MGATDLSGQIEFLQFHLPGLTGGDYTIEAKQTVTTKGQSHPAFTAKLSFSVAGERILFKPTDVRGVFPPEGSLLDHSNILPHIVLDRSTIPWERNAFPGDPESPWLALLLFEEGESFTQSTVKLKDLPGTIPGFALGPGEDNEDSVVVIDLPASSTLLDYLPTGDELKLLGHVRRDKDGSGAIGDELAVVIGNRMPAKGVKSIVHLVALEGRYKKDNKGKVVFDRGTGNVRLISLKSWNFSCLRTYLLTEAALASLQNKVPAEDMALLKLLQDVEITGREAFLEAVKQKLGKDAPARYRDVLLVAAEWKKAFPQLLKQLDKGTLRLPAKGVAEPMLGSGFVPLPHGFRNGNQFVSWYHGPLLPGKNASGDWSGPVQVADALLRYYPSTGLLDVSYAAAWELGRLLALSSKSFSVGLYNWKRKITHQALKARQSEVHDHPLGIVDATAESLPEAVTKWFSGISLLNHIPSNYLVPDEVMLPVESIRFFQVDPLWMDCLLDGSFSIGRVIQQDIDLEKSLENQFFRFPYRSEGLSGVLIRSEVVAGWPGLFVEGYAAISGNTPQQPVRREQLSKNVLLCLFEGELTAVDIHLKPESMHFGLDESDKKEGEFVKHLRKADGSADKKVLDTIPWRNQKERVLNIEDLAAQIKEAEKEVKEINAAWFALEMIESSVKVRFTSAGV